MERDRTGNRLNDGKADAAGRIWIGTMSLSDNGAVSGRMRKEIESTCTLYRVAPDYTCTTRLENVKLSNRRTRVTIPPEMGMVNSRPQGAFLWCAVLAREGFPSTASREREAGGNSLLEKRHRLLLGGNIEFPARRRARSGERGARGISRR